MGIDAEEVLSARMRTRMDQPQEANAKAQLQVGHATAVELSKGVLPMLETLRLQADARQMHGGGSIKAEIKPHSPGHRCRTSGSTQEGVLRSDGCSN